MGKKVKKRNCKRIGEGGFGEEPAHVFPRGKEDVRQLIIGQQTVNRMSQNTQNNKKIR